MQMHGDALHAVGVATSREAWLGTRLGTRVGAAVPHAELRRFGGLRWQRVRAGEPHSKAGFGSTVVINNEAKAR